MAKIELSTYEAGSVDPGVQLRVWGKLEKQKG